MSEYPKMLFRAGTEYDVNGIHVDTRIVSNEAEERACLLAGWRVGLIQHPLDHDGDGHLGGSLPKRRGRPPKPIAETQAGAYTPE